MSFNIPIIPILIVIFIFVFLTMVPVGLWITARFSGVAISMAALVAMRFRKVKPSLIVNALIKSHQAGIMIKPQDLESHYLSGGDVNQAVDALIAAERANIDLTFEQAAAMNLAGRNVFEAVQVSVTPKVINTPKISAVAQNGIEVLVIAKVTVRANIDRLVGGAGEETIIARVGEGIVTTVGSSFSHSEVLENPDNISKTVLGKGLDSGTAFEILSIDIADIDIGRNVGAQLQLQQAEADKNIAQAKAEERRSQAIALEQENRAKVVEAESKIPEAIAKALSDGNLGVLDYYNMKNINADTEMRKSISNPEDGDI
ncbi:MAG: flotillin-like protein FloA [Anaerococcus sp.]